MRRVMPHLRYLGYVLKHKALVLFVGLRLMWVSPWALLAHDLSKFSRAEWTPYVNHFYGPHAVPKGTRYVRGDDPAFDRAVVHHHHHNPHHSQFWQRDNPAIALRLEMQGDTDATRIPMPRRYLAEMVINWCAVGIGVGERDVLAYWRRAQPHLGLSADEEYWVGRFLLEARDAGVIL